MKRARLVLVALFSTVALGLLFVRTRATIRCGDGFSAEGARCVGCAPPLVRAGSCVAPATRVLVAARRLEVGLSDWEAVGQAGPRVLEVGAFLIDAFEVTRGDFSLKDDPTRALAGISRREASQFCAGRGGRLPHETEWISAATGTHDRATRYPWGDTGAVCRRAAWGLTSGPCATHAEGPDTVGSHAEGDSPLGIHDLAGNVAEWVVTDTPDVGVAKGGSWASAFAAELRGWARLVLPPESQDLRVGFRCAYDPPQ